MKLFPLADVCPDSFLSLQVLYFPLVEIQFCDKRRRISKNFQQVVYAGTIELLLKFHGSGVSLFFY
jgi:hypothetical protein